MCRTPAHSGCPAIAIKRVWGIFNTPDRDSTGLLSLTGGLYDAVNVRGGRTERIKGRWRGGLMDEEKGGGVQL